MASTKSNDGKGRGDVRSSVPEEPEKSVEGRKFERIKPIWIVRKTVLDRAARILNKVVCL